MKKAIALVAVLATLNLGQTFAQVSGDAGQAHQKEILTVGDVSMTIDVSAGGKILSYKYGDKEIISQSPMREAFGSTFWTSPQKEWNWPPVNEFDKMPYIVKSSSPLVIESQVSPRLKYRVRKEFSTDAKDKAIVVTYSIVNESDETRKVAPWEITRVKNENGLIFFDAPTSGITPVGLMDFKSVGGASFYLSDEANDNRKVNADGKGWLAYKNEELLMIKKFDDLDASQPAPGEAEIQVYVNRGKTYIELESQGAYTELKPGESLSWTVRWYLMPDASPVEASAKLLKQVKKVVK